MKIKILLLTVVFGTSTCLLTAQEGNPPPEGQRPPGAEARRAGPGGERRGPQLLPPVVAEQLNLAPEQREQVAKLEAEVKAKMEKILTPDQLEQMKQMRPPLREGGPARIGGPGGPPARMEGAGAPIDQMRGPGIQGRMGGQRFMMPIIEALDLNKDGIIQAEELARASKSLATLDKNEDGKLTPDEFRPPRLGGPGGFQGPGGDVRRAGPDGPGGPGGERLPPRPPPEQ